MARSAVFCRRAGDVLDAAGLDVKSEEHRAVERLTPAERVALLGEFERLCVGKFVADAILEFLAEPLGALFLEDILEPRVLAIRAVAKVAMHGEHAARNFHELLGRDESDHVRDAREGLREAVRAALPAADGEIVADDFSALLDGDVAEAIREDVHVVQRLEREGGLEFARQVRAAVERIHEVLVLRGLEVELHALDPDRVIRLRLRHQRLGDARGVGEELRMLCARDGRGRAHHVAVHVTARGDRVHHRGVDLLHQRPEAGFYHAVKLKALPRSNAQGVVPVPRRKVVVNEVTLR